MKSSILTMALLWDLALPAISLAEDHPPYSADAVQTAFDKLVRAVTDTNWPSEYDARKELVSLGPAVVPKLVEAARGHSEWPVRRSSYEILGASFANDERTLDVLFQNGLTDQAETIRYHCAFLLGDLKVQRAEQALRAAFENASFNNDLLMRYSVAKSLAQLGKADVLPVLIAAVSADSYMFRHMGNVGLKALSGKNLVDFGGYQYGEGAAIAGGAELMMPVAALTSVERKAGRFQAATAYLRWLKAERPDLYRSVDYRPRSRRPSPAQ